MTHKAEYLLRVLRRNRKARLAGAIAKLAQEPCRECGQKMARASAYALVKELRRKRILKLDDKGRLRLAEGK